MAFMALVERHRYKMGSSSEPASLTNFTFFAGAGFSKSWDPDAPVGKQLFTLNEKIFRDIADPLVLSRLFGLEYGDLSLEDVRQIIYQLDMYERYPDVCSRYIDPQNISMIRAGLRAAVMERYDELAKINYFDSELEKFPLKAMTPAQGAILQMFGHLYRCGDGSQHFAEGLRCHFATTNYDFVIETILDNVLDPEDSLFLYTYRGFTPTRVAGRSNPTTTHQHWLTWHLIKLNGGFEILRDGDRYILEYRERKRSEVLKQPPVLMLPSREQDYSDPYFRVIFPKAVRLMRDTTVLVLVGYSLPDDDALMRFIIRQFAEEAEDGRGKTILYVDPFISKEDKLSQLETIFPSIRQLGAPNVVTYEGSFSDFAAEYASLIVPTDRSNN